MAGTDQEFDIHWFTWQFIESPSEDNFCTICRRILKKPVITECCSKRLCSSCVELITVPSQCPFCSHFPVSCMFDGDKYEEILELKIECPLTSRGCEWIGNIKKSELHLEVECQYADFDCSNGCGESIERNMMEDHLKNECQIRQSICRYCQKVSEYWLISNDHLLTCPEVEVPCSYKHIGCKVLIKRSLLSEHLLEDTQAHLHMQSIFIRDKLNKSRSTSQHMLEEGENRLPNYTEFSRSALLTEQKKLREIGQTEELKQNEDAQSLGLLHMRQENTVKQLFKIHSLLWELDFRQLQYECRVTSGQFSEVWKGIQYGEKQVAIKKHKSGSMTAAKFLQEAHILQNLSHTNILTLFGVCTREQPILIITEYMIHGNLANFIKTTGNTLNFIQKADIIKQVACGMAYLAGTNCIHRGLTSRSILIGRELKCKISSFRLAQMLKNDKSEFEIPHGEGILIKWSAPEVLISRKISSKSDVWSFGILQYEVLTGKQLKMSNTDAEQFIKSEGHLLCPPPDCPDVIYEKIAKCLSSESTQRPSFRYLTECLTKFIGSLSSSGSLNKAP